MIVNKQAVNNAIEMPCIKCICYTMFFCTDFFVVFMAIQRTQVVDMMFGGLCDLWQIKWHFTKEVDTLARLERV